VRRTEDKYRNQSGKRWARGGEKTARRRTISTICNIARDHGKPVRIGVNGGSLNQELVSVRMRKIPTGDFGILPSEEIINEEW